MSSEPLIGSLIADRYRVVRRLGAGGMGTVYVALQEPLGREVALKVVRRDLAADEVALERFRREAMSLAQVQHPHIVTLLDFGEVPSGALYFAMEYVRGQTLRERLRSRGPIPAHKTLELIRQCCAALACAHALGIIHRDLKPENIMLMEAAGTPDFVKVVDFGVAKVVGAVDERTGDPEEQLTDRNSLVGTPGYIAPEVALHAVTTDPRSDLYALGVIWYECLAGQPPFRAPTPTALVMAHAVDPPPPLPETVPLAVAGLVSRLLAKKPSDRPSTAEELRLLVEQLTVAATPAVVSRAELADAYAKTAGNTPRSVTRGPDVPTESALAQSIVLTSFGAPSDPQLKIPTADTKREPEDPALAVDAGGRTRNWKAVAIGSVAALALPLGLYAAGAFDRDVQAVDAGPAAAVDAGFAVSRAADAGAAAVAAAAAPDAGSNDSATSDAGPDDGGSEVAATVDAGPRKKPRIKKPPPEVVPDIYSR